MDKKLLMRFSDLDMAVQHYRGGLYSNKEFIRDVLEAFDNLKKELMKNKKVNSSARTG